MPDSAILFLSFNRKVFTQTAFEHFLNCVPRGSCKLVVIDNGSVDGAREYLKSREPDLPDVDFYWMTKNFGAHRPRGFFMHEYKDKYKYLGYFANDVMVTNGWVAEFERVLNTVPKIGIVGPYDRDWPSFERVTESGFSFWGGNCFHFSDAYWLMRSKIIGELQKTDYALPDNTIVKHPGYFMLNSVLTSQNHYWCNISDLGYLKAAHPEHKMRFLADVIPTTDAWHKNYEILTKVVSLADPRKYVKETEGEMTYEFKGQMGAFTDESPLSRFTPESQMDYKPASFPQMDTGVTLKDYDAMSQEQKESLTYTKIFK